MNQPNKILIWLLDKCCPDSRPDLKGDFLELYATRCQKHGEDYARRKLIADSLSVVPLNFIIETERSNKRIPMFSTNLKIARRNLVKNKLNAFINVTGLSVSLTICVLIALFIKDELSFDQHIPDAGSIYRIAGNYSQGGPARVNSAQTTYLLRPMIEGNIEGLQAITRIEFLGDLIKIDDEKQYLEDHIAFADSTFFDVFRLSFVKGTAATALQNPNSVVLDRTTAIKYFGTDDVLGKLVDLRGKQFAVSGVIEPIPTNTHFTFSLLFPMGGIRQWYADWVLTNASGTSLYTYVRTKESLNKDSFASIVSTLASKRWGWEGDSAPKYFLQPLLSIHLQSNFSDETMPNGSMTTVYIFAITAAVILVLACINFINLTTAASFQRGKEVGMKKVLGSTTGLQFAQFQMESFIIAAVSTVFSVIFVVLLMQPFNELTGKTLRFDPVHDSMIGFGMLGVLVFISLIAGISPALVLLKSSTIGMLNNRVELKNGRSYLRSGLIVFQFTISVTLIVCTIVVTDQIQFIRQTDLGFDPQSVVLIPFQTSEIAGKYQQMKNEMLQNPSVMSVAASSGNVTQGVGGWRPYRPDPAKEPTSCPSIAVTVDFFETLKSEIVAGRSFSEKFSTDVTTGYILNESAVEFFGFKDPVDHPLFGATFTGSKWSERNGVVLGVVKDFHFSSLHTKVPPVVFYVASDLTENVNWLAVRIATNDMQRTVKSLETVWKKIAGDRPFMFDFLDNSIERQYYAESRFLKVFTTFSLLSIMLGALGLFGLTAFMAQRRTKEVGIRRILGASTTVLIKLLSVDFLKLVLLANLIGWPIAWYIMDDWLKNFAYQITIPVWVFPLTLVAVTLLSFACILYHALRVSRISPVKTLRNE